MNSSNHSKPIIDNSFSAFVAGLTVGIAGVLLLGTKEGKKITQKALKSIPEDLTNLFSSSSQTPSPPPQVTPPPTNYPPPPPSPPQAAHPNHPKPTSRFFS
jgi:hypothetical protein